MNRQVKGKIRRVLDGDTFIADLDLGWHLRLIAPETGSSAGRIRVLHYYAPELNEPGGLAAKQKAQELLPVGSEVEIDSHSLDSFGRSLATVTLLDGRDFATTMIEAGLGHS